MDFWCRSIWGAFSAIKQLITSGVPESELLTRVMRAFPNLTSAELSA
jgi:hypothetical protein